MRWFETGGAILALAVLTACGAADPQAAPAPAPSASPAVTAPAQAGAKPSAPAAAKSELTARAAQVALDAGTRKVRTARTGRLTWTAELASVTGRLTQSARNTYDLGANRWAAKVTVRAAEGTLAFDYAAAGSKLYVTFRQGMPAELRGRWLGLDRSAVPELETGRAVIDALAAVRATGARRTAAGTVVQGTLPARLALGLLALSGVPELAGRTVGGTATVEIRLDPAGRVVGLAMRGGDVKLAGDVPASVRRSVAGSKLSAQLAGFGSPVTVTTPKKWTPVDAQDLPGR